MRRLFRILAGCFVAMLAAAATQVRFAMPHAPSITEGSDVLVSWWSDYGMLTLATATHITMFSLLFALIAIVIAEWQGLREWTYYVIAGVVIALGGYLAQYASENAAQPTILNNYALIAFATTGMVGGLAYWLVSGHGAGRIRRRARIEVAEIDGVDGGTKAVTETDDTSGAAATGMARADNELKGAVPAARGDRRDTGADDGGVALGRPRTPVAHARPAPASSGSVPQAGVPRSPVRLKVAPLPNSDAPDGKPFKA